MQRCSECKNICKENKRIIKDDKLQTLGISFSIPNGVATVGGGVRARAQVFGDHDTVWAQGSLGNTKGLGDYIGDGVATRMKPGNTLQQLDSTEDTQKSSSEIGFGNWVWAFVWPTQPFGWPPCVFIFYYLLII